MGGKAQLEQAAADCGVCKYVSVDLEEYHFQSRESPQIFHTVHLADYNGNGRCSCPHFDFRIRPLLEARMLRPHESRAACRHITRANKILLVRVKKQLFNPNPK